MSIASALISLPIAFAGGLLAAWPFVLAVTLVVVMILGAPAFLLIRLGRRARWLKICVGGFITGALFPALNLLPGNRPAPHEETVVNAVPRLSDWTHTLLDTGMFGLAGIAGALITWLLLGWLAAGRAASPRRHLLYGAAVASLVASSLAGAVMYQRAAVERSCQMLSDSAQPLAGLELHIAPQEWPALRTELERFARGHGWSLRTDLWPEPSYPFFNASLCIERGPRIDVMYLPSDDPYIWISAGQPGGGNGWQAPLHALHRRLEARWPGSIRYPDGANATQRPPWAPPVPPPSRPAGSVR
jgi:hypothetical protein